MSVEDNKQLAQRFIQDVFNSGSVDAITKFCIPDSMLAGGLPGQIMVMKTAFPDNTYTIDEVIAEDNKVVIRSTSRGTNTGPLLGLPAFGRLNEPIPPTGNSIIVTTVFVFTIKDGKIAGMSQTLDQMALLQQLGWQFTPPNNA